MQTNRLQLAPPAFAVLVLGAVAFAVRLYGLGAQSLWHDEGASLYYASLAPSAMIEQVASLGEIPPLYYLLLHYWLGVAGTGEFALRFPSAAFGAVSIPLLYVLGRRLGGAPVGLVAALFLAVSPLHVWQSQEVRMYTLAVALSVTSLYLFARLLNKPDKRLVVAYAAAGTAGLYAHFTFVLVLAAQAVCLALWLPFHRRRLSNALWVAVGAIISGLTFLPWLGVGLLTYATGTTYWPGRLDVGIAVRDTLASFVQGQAAQAIAPNALAVAAGALALTGILLASLAPRASGGLPAWLLIACYFVVPAALLFWLLLDRPKFGPRYLLVALPALALAAGWAVSGLFTLAANLRAGARASSPLGDDSPPGTPRFKLALFGLLGAFGLAVGGGCLWVSLVALQAQASDPRYAREDFRGLAAYLADKSTAEEAIVLLGGHIQLPFLHYYRDVAVGKASVFPLPDTLMPAVAQPIQADDLPVLNDIVPGRRTVWVVRWQEEMADPAGMVVRQLELAGRRVDPGRAFHGLSLDAFAIQGTPRFPISFAPQVAVDAAFANGLSLIGYDLKPERPTPGETLDLTLYWRVDVRVEGDLVAFTQLLNAGDHIYAQHDKPPVSELYKTSMWTPGDLLKDEYHLRVHPGSPPGAYRLVIGLYDRKTMQRVAVQPPGGAPGASSLPLAQVTVAQGAPAGASAVALRNPVSLELAPETRLLGFEVEQDVLHPGDTARIALLWQASAPPGAERHVYLALRAPGGQEVARSVAAPADGTYPTTRWRADDLVRDVQNLKLPAGVGPGTYDLVAALPLAGQAPGEVLRLGAVEVR